MLLLIALPQALRFAPSDPDDYMRLLQVRDWLGGQSWWDVRQYRMDPPAGADMHWSRLVDLPIAAFLLVFRLFLDERSAQIAAMCAVPLLQLGVAMALARRLVRELGVGGFLAVQLVVGGSVLASLVHPLLIVSVLMSFTIGSPVWTGALTAALFGTTIFSGYVISVLLGAIGLSRRGLMPYAWVLLLMPLHWLLLSLAAWRALYQLLHSPYGWEKTEHGLARTSRVVHRSRPRPSSPVNRQ
jgi:hypothetical protein